MSFVDKVRLFPRGGDGGKGCVSFRREKYVEMGGPNGGDGGKGGDVILQASSRLRSFADLARSPHLMAEPGHNGKGSAKTGRCGADRVVLVPLGTVISKDGKLLAELCKNGERFLAAAGGRGGRGNLSFKTGFNKAPRIAEKGEPGEAPMLDLDLKLLADVGLVGLPNAGKSSFLARVSRARPKVADYPFTTLAPELGVAAHKGAEFVLADIPGLIEGASLGKGLGLEFLRHVERTRVLVHLVDPLGFQGGDALSGIKAVEGELAAFGALLGKPRILAVNKMDLPGSAQACRKVAARYRRRKVLPISAVTGAGMEALLDEVVRLLSLPEEAGESPSRFPRKSLVKMERAFEAKRVGPGVLELKGRTLERKAAMLNADLPEAVRMFQEALKRMGVDRVLKRLGVREADTVRCGKVEFEWGEEAGRR